MTLIFELMLMAKLIDGVIPTNLLFETTIFRSSRSIFMC